MQTNYIDIYILHAMDEEHLEEVARVMGLLKKKEKFVVGAYLLQM